MRKKHGYEMGGWESTIGEEKSEMVLKREKI